jgi:hypothetical protein
MIPGSHSSGFIADGDGGSGGQPQSWNSADSGHPGVTFKEEDEFMHDDM